MSTSDTIIEINEFDIIIDMKMRSTRESHLFSLLKYTSNMTSTKKLT